jgi:hypothetical protein
MRKRKASEPEAKRLLKKMRKETKDALPRLIPQIDETPEQQAADIAARASLIDAQRRQGALKKRSTVVQLPPLPPVTLGLWGWGGADVLKSWAGFGAKRGSKGKVDVGLDRAHSDTDDAPVPPAEEMVAGYAHLKQHEAEMAKYRSEISRK